jgi:anti-sigma B factor antagonist
MPQYGVKLMEKTIKIEREKKDDYSIFKVDGSIYIKTAPILKDNILDTDDIDRLIILDLTELEFLDSMGIATLININNQLMKKSKILVIVTSVPQIIKTIKITQLNRIIHILPSIEEVDKLLKSNFNFNEKNIGNYPK